MRFLLLFFVHLNLMNSYWSQTNELPFCVPRCICYQTTIRCMHLNLDKVSVVPAETTLLDLRFNNIIELHQSSFRHLSLLTTLLLNNNKIEKLPDHLFAGIAELKYLYLYQNNIKTIGKKTFKNLHKLQQLYLNHNKIETLHEETFADLPSLQKLYLQHNRLRHISSNIFHKDLLLKALRLDGNPLICDCQLLWLIRLSKRISQIQASCHSPQELSGKNLSALVSNELKCEMPQIIEEPNHLESNKESVSLKCKVKGEPEPEILWLHDNTVISLDTNLINKYSIINDGSTLMIKQMDDEVEGIYQCVAKNIVGQVKSKSVMIKMQKPLKTDEPTDTIKELMAGPIASNLLLSCNNFTNILWSHNNNPIDFASGHYQLLANGSLLIKRLTPADKGIFKCTKLNGKEVTLKQIKVLEPPVFTFVPESIVEVDAGKKLVVMCEASGIPIPKIKWIRKDPKSDVGTGPKLIIKNLKPINEGFYECIAENEVGIAIKTFKVKVRGENNENDESLNVNQLFEAVNEAKSIVDQAINSTLDYIKKKKNIHSPGKLMQIARFPLLPESIELAKSVEIFEKSIELIRRKSEGKQKLPTTSYKYEDLLTPNQLNILAHLSGCLIGHRLHNIQFVSNCQRDVCFHQNYRSYDGTCNNFEHQLWGASLTPFHRLLPPIYEDGMHLPVGWFEDKKYGGFKKPNAREVCHKILASSPITPDTKHTHMLMQWGQFLDHDLDFSLPSISINTFDRQSLDCSKTCQNIHPCFSIKIPNDDPRRNVTRKRHLFRHSGEEKCIELVRSSASCGSGMTSIAVGTLMHREQVNQLTAFVDASQVYGSTSNLANHLRDRIPRDEGLLRNTLIHNKEYLPFNEARLPNDCQQDPRRSDFGCFLAGDVRANEQLGLLAMHTLWLREHNRIAKMLRKLNPLWTGENIYQESRKIVGAQMQVITYNHWLPNIIGIKGMKKLGDYNGYNDKLNPSVANVFATATLRFGHTLINPFLTRLNESYQPTINYSSRLSLRDAFFAPHRLVEEGGIDPLLRGLLFEATKKPKSDQIMNKQLTEHLFELARDISLDLGSLNIQRGRDHGIPGYNEWRKFCNLTFANTFDDMKNEIKNEKVRVKLQQVYGHPDNVDLWVGAVAEDIIDGAKVGPTFQCLLIEQFKRLRDADRFWYQASGVFTQQQLAEINKASLARVICDNADNITTITSDVFILPDYQGWRECQTLQHIDLLKWQNTVSPIKSCSHENENDSGIPDHILAKFKHG